MFHAPLVCAQVVPVQGESIATLPFIPWPDTDPFTGGSIDGLFFFDTLHGIVSVSVTYKLGPGNNFPTDFADTERIFYTSNTRTWKAAILPQGVKYINAIRFIGGKLYAATFGPDLLVSTDSGATWNYSGLGLGDAQDVYSDPTGTVRTLHYDINPEGAWGATFARVDRLHCLWTDSYFPARISSDGGITWTSTGIHSPRFDCYGDTCTKVFMFLDTYGVYRSTDYGLSWQENRDSFTIYPNRIEGNAEVVYLENGNQTTRYSVDAGTTWKLTSFNAESGNYLHLHIPVFGPMGNYLVWPIANQLYLLTSGIDGMLHGPLDSYLLTSDSLRISSSCPVSIPIPFAATVDSISTTVSIQSDTLKEFRLRGQTSFVFNTGQRDTTWIDYSPRVTPSSSTLKLLFHYTWHCSDWTETRTVIVTSPPTAYAVAPKAMQGSCDLVLDTGRVSIDSCQSLVITNVTVTPSLANRLRFEHALPDTVRSNNQLLPFAFDPHDTNANGNVQVVLRGYYLGTSVAFDTILSIHIAATPASPELQSMASSFDFGPVSTCIGSHDTSVVFTNHGCAPDTITSLYMSGTGFSWLRDSLPIIVPPGDSVALRFRFAPVNLGAATGTAEIDVVSMGLPYDPILSLAGTSVRGAALLSLKDSLLDFGTMTVCHADTTLSFTLANQGCDTLLLSDIGVDSLGRYVLSDTSHVSLAPDSSRRVSVRFRCNDTGLFNAAFHVHGVGVFGEDPTDRTLSLVAHVTHGSRIAALSTKAVDFGSLRVCEERDTAVWLKNTGCDTLRVFGDSIAGTNGTYRTDATYPLVILPGDSKKVTLHLAPDTTGAPATIGGVVFFNSNSDLGQLTLPLQASISYPSHFSLALTQVSGTAPATSAIAGTAYTIQLTRQAAIPPGLAELDFTLRHDDDMLTYLSTIESDVHQTNSVRLANGDALQTFAMSPVVDRPTLATIQFHTNVAQHDSTAISLVHDTLLASGDLPASCIALVDSTPSSNLTVVFLCGQQTIRNMLRDLPIDVSQVEVVDRSLHFTIERNAIMSLTASAEIIDVLGQMRARKSLVLGAQENAIEWNLAGVPSGAYFLRITSNGFAATRRLLVVE
ncbi:MAG: choice-of-anchor D domain-containing protein [Bacteroidota bacterium]|nr:choice-of-anchor D domain-containing protein [Bacteroidota bacterium]MDP4234599.1 choice-of-anchor D domain-containing protein [Bacteroidota bacterium]MDP4243802.1 choice-of-anchor D domain-containing protein [Bacteroidota bacterium]MDP4288960.1 choice-of-anchor D domain-containing protein [Bacteroidota bacterium]